MTAQKQVADLVAQRGYRDPYTAERFAARQVAKMLEEIAEMAELIGLPMPLLHMARAAGNLGKYYFDNPCAWPKNTTGSPHSLAAELADLQVVIFCLADALDELTGGFDVVEKALEKAGEDVKRGVR